MIGNKNEQLNQLFDSWETEVGEYTSKFVRDGIIYEDLFEKASPKILFMMKEPNNPDQKSGDFRKWWKDELKGSFDIRLAEWSYGLLNNFPPYDSIWMSGHQAALNSIHKIAFMNIKKSGGKSVSNEAEMNQHARQNKNYIHHQISIIDPEIIVLGWTWESLRTTIFPNLSWKDSGHGARIARFNTIKIIDFIHPSSRTSAPATYYFLKTIVSCDSFKNL